MTVTVRSIGLAVLLVLGGHSLSAQAFGVPVQADGMTRGGRVYAAIGFPNESGYGGTAGVVGLSLGARRVGVTGFVNGHVGRDDQEDLAGAGAAVNLKVFGGPLVPFAVMLHGGAAYGEISGGAPGASQSGWRVPVAVAVSWTFPRPIVALKPWVAPRVEWNRTRVSDIEGNPVVLESTDPGISAGIVLGFLNGLGVTVSYDRLLAGSGSPATVGVGLSFQIW